MERDINSLIVKLRSPYLIVHLVSLWFHRVQLEENAHGVPQMLDPTAIPLIFPGESDDAPVHRVDIASWSGRHFFIFMVLLSILTSITTVEFTVL